MVSRDQALLLNQEHYFFFPALVQAENPADVCKSLDTITYQCGWVFYINIYVLNCDVLSIYMHEIS